MDQEKNKIVLVTGASRGLGRGIARQFGSLGSTVYLTSRQEGEPMLSQAANEVNAAGGKAVPVAVDHRDAVQVEQLMQRIREENGKLDILVNNAAATHPQLSHPGPFWQKSLALGDMIEVGLHTNYITAYFAAPLMVERQRGLIANISFYGAVTYFHGPAYGAAKAGTDKMSFDMALDLQPHNVACVSLWPGFIFSDAVAAFIQATPKEKLPATLAQHVEQFERPEFSGAVINALHDDPNYMQYSGQALIGAELGLRYGIRDIDGKQPLSYRDTMGEPLTFLPPNPNRPMK